MTPLRDLPREDLERLSAYLDGELPPREAARLEARLRQEPQLRRALEDLRATSRLLRELPTVRPPRSFTLTPEMVGARERRSWRFPALSFATALAAVAFACVLGLDLVARTAPMAAQAPFAVEGVMESPPEATVAALEAPAEAPAEERAVEPMAPLAAEEAEVAGTPAPEAGAPADQTLQATATPTPVPTLTPEPMPVERSAPAAPLRAPLTALRVAEVALALVTLILAFLTLRARAAEKP